LPELATNSATVRTGRSGRIEELELVEAQDTLVDLSGLLARAYDFDHVTERRDHEHFDRLRKHRPRTMMPGFNSLAFISPRQ
jgi:hypothetical protein